MKTNTKQHYDIHLSVSAISVKTTEKLQTLGMTQDELQNNRNSVEPHYHGSMPHMKEPGTETWESLKRTLSEDPNFRGALEFEINDTSLVTHFETKPDVTPESIASFKLEQCKPGEHKACDVHIRVDPTKTSAEAIMELEKFNFIYFERKVKGIWHPVYTLTFEDSSIGEAVMERLIKSLDKIPNLVAKIKLEKIHDYWVHPADATQLPIVRTVDAKNWLLEMN